MSRDGLARRARTTGSLPRRLRYASAAALLALGAPAGLLVLRLATGSHRGGVGDAIAGDLVTFAYVTVGTVVAFASFGYVVGRQADALMLLSLTDSLTGLRNRAAFDEGLAAEAARAARYRQPLSLLMMDVDGLKSLNDRGGHHAGDEALRTVAEALRQHARRTDLAARLGGDEFGLLAPATALPEAVALAERIRARVAEKGARAGVTVSIGVATGGADGHTAGELGPAADTALYEAKRAGRNRVAPARHPPVQ